jgi:hypothetical protein
MIWRINMKKRAQELLWLLTGVFLFLLLPGVSKAAALSVNCNGPAGTLNTIGAALNKLNPAGPNTINVSGSCKENVVIQGFGRLTLNAHAGASITDASGGTGVVVDIEDSTDVTLHGFTISGGDINVLCGDFSVCRFKSNTVQGAVAFANGTGVQVVRSRAVFDGDIIQDNAGRGLNLVNGSDVLATGIRVNNNQADGIFVGFGTFLVVDLVTIQNNAANGVHVINHSTFRIVGGTIAGNGNHGVRLQNASEGTFQSANPINVVNNGNDGVRVDDLSFANFVNFGPPLNVKGNVDLDVACRPQFSATRGALTDIGGGTTNCTEP